MIRALRTPARVLLAAIFGCGLGGCGGERQATMKAIEAEAPVVPGPAATPEELAGTVPPLRGLAESRPLVPTELIPPDAPADPEPGFEPAGE